MEIEMGKKYPDIEIGNTYGRWTVIGESKRRGTNGCKYWACQCSCENKTVRDVKQDSLKQGTSKSCGCIIKDVNKNRTPANKKYSDVQIGGKYGHWTVISKSNKITGKKGHEKYYWVCKCDCYKGTTKEIREDGLKTGMSTSCGCTRIRDLTGKTFGYLTVIKLDINKKYLYNPNDKNNENRMFWECRCKCGNIITVRQDCLVSGSTKSCGCLSREHDDLTGQVFGELTVISYNSIKRYGEYGASVHLWNCRCTCGNIVVVRQSNLKCGVTMSCGCRTNVSKGGRKITNILKKYNIPYQKELRFNDCRDKKPLPFDFVIFDNHKNRNILCAVEFDGEYHYMPIKRGSMTQEEAKKSFKGVQKRDKIKTEYCKKNNIPLIRIPYWERDNLEFCLFDELEKLGIKQKILV